jgi:hypothetical protein
MKTRSAKRNPAPPRGLCPEARTWWTSVRTEYGITDPGGLKLLDVAARALHRLAEARALVDREGCTTQDRFGQRKTHPAVAIERDSRSGFLAAVRQLGLELEPVGRPGRPGGR